VVAEEEDGVGGLDPLDHAEVLVEALDQVGPGVDLLHQDVRHGPVAVVDDDLGGAAGEGALDRGVDISGHHPPHELVVGLAVEHFVSRRHSRDAFGVGGDEDAHQ